MINLYIFVYPLSYSKIVSIHGKPALKNDAETIARKAMTPENMAPQLLYVSRVHNLLRGGLTYDAR
jgi:hypothetical protein